MGNFIYVLSLVTIGVALLWFGYALIIGKILGRLNNKVNPGRQEKNRGNSPGDPQVCPICSSKLIKGDFVKTLAFPSLTGGKDRFMHIRGCMYCLEGNFERRCPVCHKTLGNNDILLARMFERTFRRSHVHVLGCSLCKRVP